MSKSLFWKVLMYWLVFFQCVSKVCWFQSKISVFKVAPNHATSLNHLKHLSGQSKFIYRPEVILMNRNLSPAATLAWAETSAAKLKRSLQWLTCNRRAIANIKWAYYINYRPRSCIITWLMSASLHQPSQSSSGFTFSVAG